VNLLIAFIVSFINRFSLKNRYIFADFIGSLISYVPTSDRKVAQLQIEKILKDPTPIRTTKQVYCHLTRCFVEAIDNNRILSNKGCVECADPALLDEMISCKTGKLLLTAHLGNWEVLAAWYTKLEPNRLSVIGKELRNRFLQARLSKLRSSYGVRVLDKDKKGVAFSVVRALKRNEAIGVLIDQDTNVENMTIPFFSHPAATPNALVEVALAANATIYGLFGVRLEEGKFLVKPTSYVGIKNSYDLLCRYNQDLEELIRSYPSQWVWIHKRWRTMPNGQRLRTNDYLKYLKQL